MVITKNGSVSTLRKLPYRPGDILYVRETFCWCPCWDCGMDTEDGCADEIAEKFYNSQKGEWGCYGYKASFAPNEAPFGRWHPSIYMPREAARIFLRVADVRVERLQELTEADAMAEGVQRIGEKEYKGTYQNYASPVSAFHRIWDGTIDTVYLGLYGWDADPWVWVIEFERISKEKVE